MNFSTIASGVEVALARQYVEDLHRITGFKGVPYEPFSPEHDQCVYIRAGLLGWQKTRLEKWAQP